MIIIKHKVRKTIIILLIFSLLPLSTACWDQREVEDIGVVFATGIDLNPDGKIKLIVQTINPTPIGGTGGSGGIAGVGAPRPFSNYSYESNTVLHSIRELSRIVPRQLFFAHNQIIIVSEKFAAERGMDEVLDFFLRNPQIRRTTWLLIAKDDLPLIMNQPAQLIVGLIEDRHLNSKFAIQRIGDFAENLHSKKVGSYTAILERRPNEAVPSQPEAVSPGTGNVSRYELIISGTAVFKGDKMIGELNATESRGLLWVLGEVDGGAIEVKDEEQKENILSLEILRSKSRVKPEIIDGNIYFTVEIHVISNVAESATGFKLSQAKTIKNLESLQSQAVKSEVTAVLNKAQKEYKVDIFDFSGAVYRKYPEVWKTIEKDWNEIFPNIQVNVKVKSVIRRTGLVTEPLKAQKVLSKRRVQ